MIMPSLERSFILEVPAPVLMNPWKHHARFLQRRINQLILEGVRSLEHLPTELLVLGHGLMDLYLGEILPHAIASTIIDQLNRDDHFELERYYSWIDLNGGYRVLELEDTSKWVMRCGDDADRYLHVHPGRWSPLTCRVRANAIKTAIVALTLAGIQGTDPTDIDVINKARVEYLDLSPVGKDVNESEGLGAVIRLLRG
jgi:hypothetical protein